MTPPASSIRPGGSDPAVTDHVYGMVPPAAWSVALYAVPLMPLGRELVVTDSGAGATVSVNDCVAVVGVVAESLADTVMLNDPATEGVPLITPVLAFKVSPVGSDPLAIDQTYGVMPPVARNVALYALPAVALGSDVVVMTRGTGATVSVNARLAVAGVAAESVTETVKVNEPATVGVPVITPVLAFSVKPAGNVPFEIAHV